jgi:hypothetical protein
MLFMVCPGLSDESHSLWQAVEQVFSSGCSKAQGEGLLSHESDGCFSTTCWKGHFMVVLGTKFCYA